MICKKCNNTFPIKIKIDNKIHNLCNRKLCLECLPFKTKFESCQKEIGTIVEQECNKHGLTKFIVRPNNRLRCKACAVDSVTASRQKKKAKLVELHGGCCKICGYNKCQQALQFHHINPEDKSFTIGQANISLDRLIKETDKCVLLCANCHAEIEAGIVKLGC